VTYLVEWPTLAVVFLQDLNMIFKVSICIIILPILEYITPRASIRQVAEKHKNNCAIKSATASILQIITSFNN
jgi:hypothetical protein